MDLRTHTSDLRETMTIPVGSADGASAPYKTQAQAFTREKHSTMLMDQPPSNFTRP